MAIIIAASAVETSSINNAADLALAVEPLFGKYASIILGIGLFAAGITSAITAPLAAAYVARECFGWKRDLKDAKFRMVWIAVLLIGLVLSSLGFKPIEVIRFAQVANGLLLPIIAIFLLWIVNKKDVLGKASNSVLQNIIGLVILAITVLLGTRSLIKVFFE